MSLDSIIHRNRPSWWERFLAAPYSTVAQTLYTQRQRLVVQQRRHKVGSGIVVVCLSDTHNTQPRLPHGDLLVHAGDLTQGGTVAELQSQLDWLDAQPHLHKIVIAGNHDLVLDERKCTETGISTRTQRSLRWGSITYLQHSEANLNFSNGRRLTVFGHPSTRRQGNWAFQYEKDIDSFTHRVNDDVDILVTHSPPQFHLDVAGWGDRFLLRELWRVKPRLHVFGHVHEGYGKDILVYDRFERLYERVRTGESGMWALVCMALLLLLHWAVGFKDSTKQSILINASVVGGLLNETSRKVQVVQL